MNPAPPHAGEAPAQPQRDDVLRSLGMKTQQQKKKERQAAKRQQGKGSAAAAADASDSEGEEAGSSDDEEGPQQGRPQQGDPQAPAAQQQQGQRALPPDELEPVAFIPSKTFTGARPGMAFKKGPRGLGYYPDAVQQRQAAAAAAAGGGGKRKGKAADAAKAAQKTEFQELKKKYSHAPIGGKGADHNQPAAGRKARQAQQAAAQAGAKVPPAKPALPAAPLLPGRLKELKRQRQLAAAAGQLEGFSSSDDEGPVAAAPAASKRHKALPGRLRKKLAKQKAAGRD